MKHMRIYSIFCLMLLSYSITHTLQKRKVQKEALTAKQTERFGQSPAQLEQLMKQHFDAIESLIQAVKTNKPQKQLLKIVADIEKYRTSLDTMMQNITPLDEGYADIDIKEEFINKTPVQKAPEKNIKKIQKTRPHRSRQSNN